MKKWLDEFHGDRIYVETNIFLYVALNNQRYGESCENFLNRAMNKEFEIFTSSLTIDEIAFIALVEKLEELHGITSNKTQYLKKYPEIVKSLSKDVNSIVNSVVSLGMIVEVNTSDIQSMQVIIEEDGLLPRDALHLSVASRLGIKDIASNDPDMERIERINIYKPRAEM